MTQGELDTLENEILVELRQLLIDPNRVFGELAMLEARGVRDALRAVQRVFNRVRRDEPC